MLLQVVCDQCMIDTLLAVRSSLLVLVDRVDARLFLVHRCLRCGNAQTSVASCSGRHDCWCGGAAGVRDNPATGLRHPQVRFMMQGRWLLQSTPGQLAVQGAQRIPAAAPETCCAPLQPS